MVTRLYGKRYGKMGLTHSWWPKKYHILMSGNEGEINKLHYLLFVQIGVKGKIIFLYGLCCWQSCCLHSCLNAAFLTCGNFLFQKMVQKRKIGTLVLLAISFYCL